MDILSSLFWCIIGITGGAIVAIINNKRKRLTRKMFTVNLISEKVSNINGLEIKYNSHPIKNLYSSTIQIKNTGNITINNVDIPKKRPLSIYTDGIFIIDKLNMQLPDSSNDNDNDIHVTFDKSNNGTSSIATIDFEFISPRQVITISLLHTGNISLGKWMIKDGKVLESNEILDETDSHSHLITSKPLAISGILMITILATSLFINILNAQKLKDELLLYQNDNHRMENYINDLTKQVESLETKVEILSQTLNDRIFPIS